MSNTNNLINMIDNTTVTMIRQPGDSVLNDITEYANARGIKVYHWSRCQTAFPPDIKQQPSLIIIEGMENLTSPNDKTVMAEMIKNRNFYGQQLPDGCKIIVVQNGVDLNTCVTQYKIALQGMHFLMIRITSLLDTIGQESVIDDLCHTITDMLAAFDILCFNLECPELGARSKDFLVRFRMALKNAKPFSVQNADHLQLCQDLHSQIPEALEQLEDMIHARMTGKHPVLENFPLKTLENCSRNTNISWENCKNLCRAAICAQNILDCTDNEAEQWGRVILAFTDACNQSIENLCQDQQFVETIKAQYNK